MPFSAARRSYFSSNNVRMVPFSTTSNQLHPFWKFQIRFKKFQERQRNLDEERLRKELVGGCRTTNNRTVINTNESDVDKRKKLSVELKNLGNDYFQREEFSRAMEFYSSAILQDSSNPILFTNRAQAYNKLNKFDEAIEDCKAAIKLKPAFIKAHVHLAKALQGRGEFQKALDILEIAENIPEKSSSWAEVLKKYRQEVVRDMKRNLLQKV